MRMVKRLLGILVAAALGALVGVLALQMMGDREGPKSSTLDFEGTLHDIGELATAEYGYTLTRISDKEAFKLLGLNIPFTSSKVIYSYSGQVKAGLPFQKIGVTVNEDTKTIRIRLPQAVILSSEVDYDSFCVYDEKNSVFNPFTSEDFNQNLKDFQQAGEEEALAHGLLDRAAENAQGLLRTTLAGFYDLTQYKVEFY